ncbi:hypothetical protein OIU76_009808 [Salix suchowensis]|nr:hypothetical protein OIU76_009808 [Salix suchowensis]
MNCLVMFVVHVSFQDSLT